MVSVTRIPEGMSGRRLAKQRSVNTGLTKFQLRRAEKLLSSINQLVVKIEKSLATDKYAAYDSSVSALEKEIISYSKLPHTESNLLNYIENLKLVKSKKERDIILSQIVKYVTEERSEIKEV